MLSKFGCNFCCKILSKKRRFTFKIDQPSRENQGKKNIMEDDELLPSCAVCLQPFDESEHAPRVLHCGHSLCESCIITLPRHLGDAAGLSSNNFPAKSTNDSSSSYSFSSLIRCPECSQWTRLSYKGPSGLPKNIELLRMLGCLQALKSLTSEGRKQPNVSSVKNHDGVTVQEGRRRLSSGEASKSNDTCYNFTISSRKFEVLENERDSGDESSGENFVQGNAFYTLDLNKEYDDIRKVILSIIPGSAIKTNEGSQSHFDGDFAFGEFSFTEGELHKSYRVTLLQVGHSRDVLTRNGNLDEKAQEACYMKMVVSSWKQLTLEFRKELCLMVRLSLFCQRICRIIGLWLDERGHLFIVSKFPVQCSDLANGGQLGYFRGRIVSKRGSMNGDNCASSLEIVKHCCGSEINEGQTVDSIGEMELSNSVELSGPNQNSREGCRVQLHLKLIANIQWALELCEILMELHSEGITVGIFGLHSVAVDEYDRLMLHVTSLLHYRQILSPVVLEELDSSIPESLDVTHNKSNLHEDLSCPIGVNLKVWWQSISPEMLDFFGRKGKRFRPVSPHSHVEDRKHLDGATTCQLKQLLTAITPKADVWSLAYSLIQLFLAEEISTGYSFSETLQKFVVEKQKPDLWWHYDRDHQNFKNVISEGGLHTKTLLLDAASKLHHLLEKCFNLEPKKRPEVQELWHVLKIVRSCVSNPQSSCALELQLPPNPSSLWCFGLGGFLGDGDNQCLLSETSEAIVGCHIQPSQQCDKNQDNKIKRKNSICTKYEDTRVEQPMGLLEAFNKFGMDAMELANIEGHSDYITSLVTCGDYLLSASFDKTIRVWSIQDFSTLSIWKAHRQRVTALAVDEDSQICFSGDYGGEICMWSTSHIVSSSSQPLAIWQEHNDWRYTGVLVLKTIGGLLYSGSGDRTIKAWSTKDHALVATMEGHKGAVSSLLVDQEILFSGSWDGSIRMWWRGDHSPLSILDDVASVSFGAIRDLAMFSEYDILISARDNGCIQVWRHGECLGSRKIHANIVNALCVDRMWLITGSWDKSIKAWRHEDLLGDSLMMVVNECDSMVTSLTSHEGKIIVGLNTGVIQVISRRRHQLV